MLLGDAANHLHDQDGLAHPGAAEESDLATLHVGREQVDHLDARFEHGAARLEWLADHVEDVSQHGVADGHGDAASTLVHDRASDQSVGWLHAHATNASVADLLGDLGHDRDGLAVEHDVHLHGVVDLGQRVRGELHVHHRSGDRHDTTRLEFGHCGGHGHLILTFLSGALRRRRQFP